MSINSSARDEIAELLKLNKKKKEKFNYLIRREIKKYSLLDTSSDIEQNIFEGVIKYVYKSKFELKNTDLLTTRIVKNKKSQIIHSKSLIKLIVQSFNILKLNIYPQNLRFLIESITSNKYGKKQERKKDVLKISFEMQENYTEEFDENIINTLGIYDPDSEVDIEMKYFIDKYYQNLTIEEQEIFTRYFYEDTSYANMLEMGYVKNEYTLKSFIKKTKKYFHNQLIGDN